jgi:glycine cleavage system H protein
MANPSDRIYSKEHEWALADGDTITIGITDYAQEQLTDIVFVELPELGKQVKAGDAVAVLESVKSVADVYAPCEGEIAEVNSSLEDHPERVNEDAFGAGWIFRLKTSGADLSALMDAEAYQQFVDNE